MGKVCSQKMIEVAVEMGPEQAISPQVIARNPQQIMPQMHRANQFPIETPFEACCQADAYRPRDMEAIERSLSLFAECGWGHDTNTCIVSASGDKTGRQINTHFQGLGDQCGWPQYLRALLEARLQSSAVDLFPS